MQAPPGPVRLPVLLTYLQSDPASLAIDALLLAAAIGYLALLRRVRARRRWSLSWAGAFVAGLAVVFVAVSSGLAAYDDESAPLHLAQHVLLMMAAPPLLVLGRPLTLLVTASSGSSHRWLVRRLRPLGRVVRSPWLLVGYYASMWLDFLTPLYGYDLHHPVAHDATHGVLLVLGLCYAEAAIGTDVARSSPWMRRAGIILVGMPTEAALGLLLAVGRWSLAGSSLAATHEAGQLFIVGSMSLSGALLAFVFLDAARREEAVMVALERSGLAPSALVTPSEERGGTDGEAG